ncbi:hypothetical protein [Erwinia sp. HR93]|uniref:hypothetical protein n=1 Tax=Erwinia sp. HR93 TaxID=3094840 RepID=UPI002ADEB881|nr:hypothetical protein [Erwinia sp. HR93]MEA1063831.1 hypothetical protein [Erwinia sp. HR93]
MSEADIERLVARIVQTLTRPVTLLVNADAGYRKEIAARLADCGVHFRVALSEGVTDAERWLKLGEAISFPTSPAAMPTRTCRALVLPFLNDSLAADVVSGVLISPAAQVIHHALLCGIPVLALRYHCDPDSELNQLRAGKGNPDYLAHRKAIVAQLKQCGVTLCAIHELEERLNADDCARERSAAPERMRYITASALERDPTLTRAAGVRLTDAAMDYVKKQKL